MTDNSEFHRNHCTHLPGSPVQLVGCVFEGKGCETSRPSNFAVENLCGFPRVDESCNYVLYVCP